MKIVELLMRENLPQRNFFQASEISTLLNIKPHEIRYWETEFPQIRPQKARNGQRIYRRQDVILFSAIKHLLQEKKLTLAGAQKIIADSDELGPRLNEAPSSIKSTIVPENCEKPAGSFSKNQDRILEEASQLLDVHDREFDELTHQVYQQYSDELTERSTTKKGCDNPAKLASVQETSEQQGHRLAMVEHEKTLLKLTASRKALVELLLSLEKFSESDFGHELSKFTSFVPEKKSRI